MILYIEFIGDNRDPVFALPPTPHPPKVGDRMRVGDNPTIYMVEETVLQLTADKGLFCTARLRRQPEWLS